VAQAKEKAMMMERMADAFFMVSRQWFDGLVAFAVIGCR